MHRVQGRGASDRRFWCGTDEADVSIYVWNPQGQDGEGDKALGKFFVGKSGHWYELVNITPEAYPGKAGVHFGYERTDEAKRREANDPVSQATIAHEEKENRAAIQKERTRMNNDLLDGPTDPNPTGDTLLTAVAAIVRALATVRPEFRQQVMTAAQVLMPRPVLMPHPQLMYPPNALAQAANFYEQNHQAQQDLAKHVAAQGRAFGVGVPSPQQEQRLREEAPPYVNRDQRGEPI